MIEFIAGACIGLAVGLYIGLNRSKPQAAPPGYNENRLSIEVGPSTILFLRSVDNARLRAMAARWRDGRPLTFTAMVGRGRLFSRGEWQVIRRELIMRGLFERRRDGSVTPTPTGTALLKSLTCDMHDHTCTPTNGVVVSQRTVTRGPDEY